ncbi:sensor histidine kinase KdpD, partial [uncultured Parabacteroides sp.]
VPEGVKLIVDAVPEVVIHSDKRKILQILVKLILNAARCTTKGEIHFGYKSLYPVSVQFYVTDTGRGIPHDKLGLIFDRFVQLDEFEQGVGLGLAICKGLVTGMGGSIWVTSEEGKGSSFSFKLPFECDRK